MRKLSAVWIEISGNAKESMISTLLFETGVKVLSSSAFFNLLNDNFSYLLSPYRLETSVSPSFLLFSV